MSEKKEIKEVKKSNDSDVIASISRRLDKVVKFLEDIHGADIDGDGKSGSVATKLLIGVCAIFIVASLAIAEYIVDYDAGTSRTGDCNIQHDGTDYTLTIDKITVDQLTQSGGSADGNTVRSVARASIATTDLVVGTNSLGVVIPDNAVVWDGYIDVTTGLSSTGVTATIALELNGSADILAAVAYTNASGLNAAGLKAVIPVGTAATGVKMTGARTLNLVVGEHGGFTTGVATVVLEYDELAN